MRPFAIFTHVLTAGAFLALGFVAQPMFTAKHPTTVEGVLERARDYKGLQPCFYSSSAAHVHVFAQREYEEAGIPYDGPVIGGGLERGTPIPEDCFAVQTGLAGLSSTYWQQPSPGPKMPAWNPLPGADLETGIRTTAAAD